MEFHPEIARKFAFMGARIRVGEIKPTWNRTLDDMAPFRLDILDDRGGQIYDLQLNRRKVKRLFALDVKPKQRHLLMFCSEHFRNEAGLWQDRDHRVLCGHDEREWFCAEIPEEKRVTTVNQAMDALMPNIARNSLNRRKVKGRDRLKRKNPGFKRQGEWFFIPNPGFRPRDKVYHRNEPLMRGAGKPHLAEYLVRHGGKTVYVRGWGGFPISEGEYLNRVRINRLVKHEGWVPRVENPIVHVKGWIRHPDHKTITLQGWHRVEPNTEKTQVGNNRVITFID